MLSFERKKIILLAFFSLVLTIWCCQFIFSPNNQMLGIETADSYQGFAMVTKGLEIIHSGHLPFGVFWLSDFYGGSIATPYYVSFIPGVAVGSLTIINALSNNMILSFKILSLISILIAQFCSYKLAKHYFQNTMIAWVLSIAYSFSAFFSSKIDNGHLDFALAGALLPGVLLLVEKMFVSPNRKKMVFASLSLVALFFCDLQITIFSMYYLLLRIAYHFIIHFNRSTHLALLKRLLECVVLFSLFAAPFLISFTVIQNVGALSVQGVTSIPSDWLSPASQYFLRGAGVFSPSSGSVLISFYLGIILFALSVVPMILPNTKLKFNRQNYLFHWFTFVFFILISIGTPLSILVTTLFVRVPNRVQILVILSVCICAGYGLLCLKNYLSPKSKRIHCLRKSKVFCTLLLLGLAMIIFVDLTSEISVISSPVPKLTGGHQFIENQKDDFRILKYPVVWAYTNYEASLIKHEILGASTIAIRSYPPSSEIYGYLINYFNSISQSSDIDRGNLTLLATLCGTKYVLIETNNSQASLYTNFFNNASEYFALTYEDQDSVVYENLCFKGKVFVVKDEGQVPALVNMTMDHFSRIILTDTQIICTQSFNRIEISVNVSEPAYVVLSQSFYPYWILENGENSPAFVKFLNVSAFHVNEGTCTINAVFSVTDQTWNFYIGCFVPLVLVGLIIYADSKGKKRLFNLGLASLLVFGIALASLGFIETITEQSFFRGWVGFGIFNKVVLGLGCLITLVAFLVFVRKKCFIFLEFLWLNIHRSMFKISETKIIFLKPINAVQSKFSPFGKLIENLVKILLVALLLFIFLANIPSLFSDRVSWVDENALGILMFVVLLYVARISLLENRNYDLSVVASYSAPSNGKISKQAKYINHLHLGILGGLMGICLAGLLMYELTLYAQGYVSSVIVLCGALGGIGFGALTSGNNRLRGIGGCVFGFIAIIVGLMMTYSVPIIIGYIQTASMDTLTPLYLWHEHTFAYFIVTQLSNMHGLFFAFFGLVAAYLGGSRRSLMNRVGRKSC